MSFPARFAAATCALLLGACAAPPAPQTSASAQALPSATASPPPSPSAAPSPVPVRHAFPIAGKASYEHTHHGYPATDIFADCNTPVVSPVDGVILEADRVDTWDKKANAGATRGGRNISILGDDGVRYYGAHFSAIEDTVQPGARVIAGQKIALVGRSGDTSVCHVHFGISPVCMRTGDWWTRRGTIWPWSYLDAWRKGENVSPATEITAWSAQNGCPAKATVEP